MKCRFCGAILEPRALGEPKRIVMVCPKDYVIQHPPTIYVPSRWKAVDLQKSRSAT